MLFAETPINALALVPLIFVVAVGFVLGDLIGLVPFFLARWKRRPGLAHLALWSSGLAGAILLPLAVPVALAFAVAALVMGRWDPSNAFAREGAALQRQRRGDEAGNPGGVRLLSERFLNQ